MDAAEEIKRLRAALKSSEEIQAELDKTVFSLKTLHDISADIYGSIEKESIMHNFLLMCMGNFGSKRGYLMLMNLSDGEVDHDTAQGYMDEELGPLRKLGEIVAERKGQNIRILPVKEIGIKGPVPMKVALTSTFFFEPHWQGVLILDDKLVGSDYTASELEMLGTLVNSLIISLKNAKFYQEVWALNQELDAKNIELSTALEDLKASLRKIELLESIKDSLNKFVPHAVTRAIEDSPTGHMPESRRQDLSVLFLDIEGYTRLCEKLGSSEVNTIIEKHFSVFMDAIHANNGDVNETAGDGLMVLFLNEDKTTNALNAASTAQTIQEEAAYISADISSLYKPLEINIGINSGKALVGAARIGAMAHGGQTYLSKATAERVMRQIDLKNVGYFPFKNVKDKVEIYQLL